MDKKEKNRIIKISMLVAALVVGLAIVLNCAAIKTAIRTINDIAGDLCMVFAAEQVETDEDLDGFDPSFLCDIQKNIDPFIQLIKTAKPEGPDAAPVTVSEPIKIRPPEVGDKKVDGSVVEAGVDISIEKSGPM